MRRMVAAAVVLCLFPVLPTWAQTGFYLPSAAPSFGQDEFRASDGTTCRSTMDGMRRLEVGSFGSGGRAEETSAYGLPGYVRPVQGHAGVYGRFSMSLDAPRQRMDCNKLFELELEKRRLEVELMKRSLAAPDRRLDELKAETSARRPRAPRATPPA